MKVLDITNITKKDIPLHYRNEYSGSAKMLMAGDKTIEQPLDFTLERSAIGSLDIAVQLKGDIDYPLIPVIKSLKEFISMMDREGRLQ